VRYGFHTATLMALLVVFAAGASAAPSYDGLYGSNSLWDPGLTSDGSTSGVWAWNTTINTDGDLWADYLGLTNVSDVRFMAFVVYTQETNGGKGGKAIGTGDLLDRSQPANWAWSVGNGGKSGAYKDYLTEVGSSRDADRVTSATTGFTLDPSKFTIEDPAYAIHVSWVGDPLAGTTNRSVWVGYHPAPEPVSIVLLGAVGGVGVLVRKRRRRSA
jgi:hypothetical protein